MILNSLVCAYESQLMVRLLSSKSGHIWQTYHGLGTLLVTVSMPLYVAHRGFIVIREAQSTHSVFMLELKAL